MSTAVMHFIGVLKESPQSALLVTLLLAFAISQAALAIAVVATPARRLLIAAAIVQAVAALFWHIAHTRGFPDGFSIWRPETLGMADLYLPVMEGVSAFFFLCLFGRTWSTAPKPWRIILHVLPSIFLLSVLIWVVVTFKSTEVFLVLFILNAGLPISVQYFFLPIVGLLAIFLLLRLVLPRLRAKTPRALRTSLLLLPTLLVINILTWTGGLSAANTVWFPVPSAVHAPAGQITSLEYCNPGGNPLAMDFSEPSAQAPRPAPMVFYIHGGEGLQGSRTFFEDGTADGVYFTQLRDELVSRGFAVGSIDYGLAPVSKIPEEIKDAKCAVRFLRSHASELGIDPQRIGVYGPSQGGYISAMLGTAGPAAGFDVGQYLNQSSRVQAVVDMWGPTDLTNFSGSPSWISSLKAGLSGGHSSMARQLAGERAESPVTYVAPNDPPFLIIHGTDDWFIAPHHSQGLAKLLHAAGVPATLVMVQHDGHGLNAPSAGKIEQPSPDMLVHMICDFFAKSLAI